MKNKINIHKVEEVGFFVVMVIVSIVIGMGIIGGIVKILDSINK
jgi:hypothetical protein